MVQSISKLAMHLKQYISIGYYEDHNHNQDQKSQN